MIDETPGDSGRVLMQDGHWLVPVEERPKGWERYELKEPIAHAVRSPAPEIQSPVVVSTIALPTPTVSVGAAVLVERQVAAAIELPPVCPSEEDVAGAVGDVAAQMLDTKPDVKLDIPADKAASIREKARKYQRDMAKARATFREFREAIRVSAENFGADFRLQKYAQLLIAGMWSGRSSWLQQCSGLTKDEIGIASDRFLRAGIWSIDPEMRQPPRGYLAHLGEESEIADIGFWINAMVGAGDIEGVIREDGGVYAAKGTPGVYLSSIKSV